MKTIAFSVAVFGSWLHGSAVKSDPGPVALPVLSEQDGNTEVLERDGDTNSVPSLPALSEVLEPYDRKLQFIGQDAEALKNKLLQLRQTSLAKLALKRKAYHEKLLQAKTENQHIAKANEELDKEIIRLQHQVAKKAAHLQKVQDGNRHSKKDMEQLAKDLEVVDDVIDKSIAGARVEAAEVIKAGLKVAEPMTPDLENHYVVDQQEDSSNLEDERVFLLHAAHFRTVDTMPHFDKSLLIKKEDEDDEEEPSKSQKEDVDQDTQEGEAQVTETTGSGDDDEGVADMGPAKMLSMLSKSAAATSSRVDLADLEPDSLVELLSKNFQSLQKHEQSSENKLAEEFKKQVKQTFHERRELRKREATLVAVKKKLTKYKADIDASNSKAEIVQNYLVQEVNKERNYLRKVNHLHVDVEDSEVVQAASEADTEQ